MAQDESEFLCPACKASTTIPDTKLPRDQWASFFRLNSTMISIMENETETPDNECEWCRRDHNKVTAEFYCTGCREGLCADCRKSHQRIKLLMKHVIVSVNDVKDISDFGRIIDFDDACPRHQSKPLELYCTEHRKLCCVMCFATSHRECNMRDIHDAADEQVNKVYETNINILEKMTTEICKIVKNNEDQLTCMEKNKEQVLGDMDTLIDQTIEHLRKMRRVFRTESEQSYIKRREELLEKQTLVTGFMKTLQTSNTLLKRIVKQGSKQQLFMTLENTRELLTSYYNQIKSGLKDQTDVTFTLQPHDMLVNTTNTLASVGTMQETETQSSVAHDIIDRVDNIVKLLNRKTNSDSCAQVHKIDLLSTQITLERVVTQRDLGIGSMSLTGGTFLDDNHLVMADHNNKKLLEFDQDFRILYQHKIDFMPCDIAKGIRNREIYVTSNSNYVYKCTLQTNMKIVSKFKGPLSNTWSIAVCGENIVIGTKNGVSVLSEVGSVLHTIPYNAKMFITYVTTSQRLHALYHYDDQSVVCRSLEGEEMFRYTDSQLITPRGICLDQQNNVYVCGGVSQNVHQISSDGKKSRILIEKLHKILTPRFVLFHPYKDMLLICSYKEETVFEIYHW